jgi:hypothetical protein
MPVTQCHVMHPAGAATLGLVVAVGTFWSTAAVAHDAEPNLKLNLVKSFQVAASLEAPQASRLSLGALEAPFIEMLRKRGKSIDQNNYDNVVSTDVQIASSGSQYAVSISFHYREPCVATRLRLDLTCPVWEHYEGLAIFTNLDDATGYVMRATKAAARLFEAEFDRH